MHLKQLDPFIGDLPLGRVHDETVGPFIKARQKKGVSNRTINIALQRVMRILRLAATVWRDEHEMTWLEQAPHISTLPETNRRLSVWESKVLTPKRVRKFAANEAKRAGYDMEKIQDALGHSDISTTQGYVLKSTRRQSVVRLALPEKPKISV